LRRADTAAADTAAAAAADNDNGADGGNVIPAV
jgi:hypothetical protein